MRSDTRLPAVRSVHLRAIRGSVRLASPHGRAYALSEPDMPRRDPRAPVDERVAALRRILDFLDVERSERYRPSPQRTYCNVYAYDYCYLAGAYLPRVWWTEEALVDLAAGRFPAVRYGETVRELTANAISRWLAAWGPAFGWVRADAPVELQDAANAGDVAIVCADARSAGRSGHLSCVIPEADGLAAARAGGVVVGPLQSQAGRDNRRRFNHPWWDALREEFNDVGFWRFDRSRATLT
jgi:hypothetical protein